MKHFIATVSTVFVCISLLGQGLTRDDNFIARPYLQIGRHPSPGSLELLWHATDKDAGWEVEIKKTADGSWQKLLTPAFVRITAAGIDAHRVYHEIITGLKPGSTFNYRVIKDGKIVFTSDAIAPKSADQPFRFVVFGDIGAGTKEAKSMALRAYESKPDLVVVPGDIIYDNGLISEYRTRFWPVYNSEKADTAGAPLMRKIPFAAAPGNHDTDNPDLDKHPDGLAYFLFWDQPLNGPSGVKEKSVAPELKGSNENRTAFLNAAGEAYPTMTNFSFDYGNAHWLFLDADNYVDWTDSALKNWVRKDLEMAKNADWRFVIFHQPGFSSSIHHFEQQQMRVLSPIFEAGKVDVAFSGHVHNYQRSFPLHFTPDNQGVQLIGGKDGKALRGRIVNGMWTLDKSFDGKTNTKPNGVIYIVTGAGGQELYDKVQNNNPDSWQKFTDKFISNVHTLTVADINGKTLTIKQTAEDGKEVDVFKITK